MIFKSIEDETADFGVRFSNVLSELFREWNEGKKGIVFGSNFSKGLKQDVDALIAFKKELDQTKDKTTAFNNTMQSASQIAQAYAHGWSSTSSVEDFITQQTKAQLTIQASEKSLKSIKAAITQFNKGFDKIGLSQEQGVKAISEGNKSLGQYLKSLNQGTNATLPGFAGYLIKTTAATVGLRVATIALNMALTMGLSVVLQSLFNIVDGLYESESELAEKVSEVTSKYKEQTSTLQQSKTEIDHLSSKYAKLSKGVNELGDNVSLSSDEYEEYKEVVNQIAELSPDLVKGYTNEGIAILAMKDNVDALTEAWRQNAKAANDALIAQANATQRDFNNKAKDLHDKPKYGSLNYDAAVMAKDILSSNDIEATVRGIASESGTWKGVSKIIYDYISSKGLVGDESITDPFEYYVDYITRGVKQFKVDIDAVVNETFSQASQAVSASQLTAMAYLDNLLMDERYSNITSTTGNAIRSIASSLGFEDFEKLKQNGITIGQYVEQMVASFNSLSAADQGKFDVYLDIKTRYNNGDCSIEEYIGAINDVNGVVSQLEPNAQKHLSVVLGLDGQDIQSQYDDLVDDLIDRGIKPDEAKEFVDGLNSEDFKIAVEFTTEFDKNRVEAELKRLQENGTVDLLNRPIIDAKLLEEAGWENAGKGAATVFTSTFANEAENLAANFTPIMLNDDGSLRYVFSPEALQKYAENVLAGLPDTAGLKIGATFEGEKAIQEAEAAADRIHVLHEQYFADTEIFSLDVFYEQIKRWNDSTQSLEAISFTDLIKDDPENDSDFVDKINKAKEKFDELKEARDKLASGELTSQEQSELEYELTIKYPNLGEFDNIVDGIDNEMINLVGSIDATTGEATGLFSVFEEMASVVQEKDIPLLNAFTQIVLGMFSAATQATPAFKNLEEALSGVSDAASLYKDIQDEFASGEGFSIDTISKAMETFGDDFWKYFTIEDGAFKTTEAQIDQMKEHLLESLMDIGTLPENIDEGALRTVIDNYFGDLVSGAEATTDPLEKLSNALKNIGTVSSYLTDIESGDIEFIDALETAVGLIAEMNKGLPEGANKYTIADFIDFDDAGSAVYKTDFISEWINKQIDDLNIDDEALAQKMKEAAQAAVEEQDTLETLTSTMDKVTSASSLLAQAQEEIAESGKVSVDTIKSLYDMFGTEAASLIKFGVDGSPTIDQDAIKSKIVDEINAAFGEGTNLAQTLILELDVQMEQEALDDTVDNYMSNVQTLQEAFDKLQSGEFTDSDLAELLREFPELRDNTDDLAGGIKDLVKEMDAKTIEAFNKAIENAETDEVRRQLEAYRDAVLALGTAVGTIDDSIKIDVEIEGVEKLWTAISEANSATGLSAESVKALQARYSGLGAELAKYNEENQTQIKLFERTANGIHLNEEAVSVLEKAYQQSTRQKLDDELARLAGKYDELTASIGDTIDSAEDMEWDAQRRDILEQMQAVATLRSQYDALTSAFYRWQQAQSTSNPRDSYESIGGGYEEMAKIFNAGWYGDDSLQAYLDLMLGEADRSAQQTIDAMHQLSQKREDTGRSLMDYWQYDEDGALKNSGLFDFLDDINTVLPELEAVTKNADGTYSFDFSPENIAAISEEFGYSAELINLFAKALIDAGAKVSLLDDYSEKLLGVEEISSQTQEALAGLAEGFEGLENVDPAVFEYSIGTMSSEDLDKKKKELEEYRAAVAAGVRAGEIDQSEGLHFIQLANKEIDRLENREVSLKIQTVLEQGKSVDELLELDDTELAVELGIDDDGKDLSKDAQEVVEKARKELENQKIADEAATMQVKIDESQFEKLINSVKEIDITANVHGLEDVKTLVDYLKKLKDVSVNVNANVTSSGGSTGSSSGGPLRGSSQKAMSMATGTAYSQGDWGIEHSGVGLGGELGRELLVRRGRYYTIGENSAEFFRYQKGDIIFNHQQTEQILKNGRILSGQRRGRAFAYGTTGRAFAVEYGAGGAGALKDDDKNDIDVNLNVNSKGKSSSSSSGGGSSEKFEEVFDWIEVLIDRIERKIDNLDLKATSIYRTWSSRNKNLKEQMRLVTEEIDIQRRGYERYMQEANSVGLDEKWAKLVRDGAIDIDTVKDEELAEQIGEYQDWIEKATECKYAIDELTESQSELYQQAFDNVVTQYEGIIAIIDQEKTLLDEYVSQIEEKGYLVSSKYYQAMIDAERSNISELQKEKEELIQALNTAVADGAIAKESEAWYEMQNQINEVTLSIEEANTAMIEYNNSIRDLEWEIFDLLQERISNLSEETEFLIDLMSNDKLYDDRGQLTDEGTATMGLHGMNYNVYMKQADQYAREMERINRELAEDPNNQTLIERKQELLELQQESILAAEDEKQAIKDMVEEGIELELDALKELIDSYKDALSAEKDLYSYQKKVADQTKEITALEKQLSAYVGDNSEETKAKVQQIKVSLEEARENLEETEYDRYISDQEELLDNLYEEYEEVLNKRLDDIDGLISDMIVHINTNSENIGSTIEKAADKVGYAITDALGTIWKPDEDQQVVVVYDSDKDGILATTTLSHSIDVLNDSIQEMIKALDRQAHTDTTTGLDQIRGYSTGTRRIGENQYAWTQEGRKMEAIIRPSDGAILTPLVRDDVVLNPFATSNIFDFANDPAEFVKNNLNLGDTVVDPTAYRSAIGSMDNQFNIQIDLPNVTNYEQFKAAMQRDKSFERMIKAMTVDKMFGGSSLKKYRY